MEMSMQMTGHSGGKSAPSPIRESNPSLREGMEGWKDGQKDGGRETK